MTLDEAKRVVGTLRRANDTWTTEQAVALDIALWLMEVWPHLDAMLSASTTDEAIHARNDVYRFEHDNPPPFSR